MIHNCTFISELALKWFEEGKKERPKSLESSADEFDLFWELLRLEDRPGEPRRHPIKTFMDSDILLLEESSLRIFFTELGRARFLLWVKTDEHLAFEKVVVPMSMFFARGRQVVAIENGDIPSALDPQKHLVLVILDAAKLTAERLRRILRCHEGEPTSKVFLNRELEVVLYLHGISRAIDDLRPLMTGLLDCCFSEDANPFDRSHTTAVVISGVYQSGGCSRVIHPGVTGRCTALGVV